MDTMEQLQKNYLNKLDTIEKEMQLLVESRVKASEEYYAEFQIAFEAYDKQRQAMLDEEVKKAESEREVASVAGYATKPMKKIRSLKKG